MLKEAKGLLEAEKNKLEVAMGDMEDKLAESKGNEVGSKARIKELETVISATEAKVCLH